jgi:hypothetical protein
MNTQKTLKPGRRIFRDTFKKDGKKVMTRVLVITKPSRLTK